MNHINMLSAKKVKLHGMTSTKWTTKDKITQYKGLINLYTRDKKIMDVDTNVARKKQYKELKMLQKEIDNKRLELDNAIRGDKQQLRNTLAEHREFQLAFHNSPPKKVIDNVNQRNFNKRKELDRLDYKMKMKSATLIDFKLRQSVLEDRLKYQGISELLPDEKTAHIITGKVQDAILKKEAALAIKQTYNDMINIMKKDALYFDAILTTIFNDGHSQGQCMISATKLGQLATEYLDDRRQEFELLEKAVKKDMVIRKKHLAVTKEKVDNAASNIKNVLRRDSDINLGMIDIEETPSFIGLKKDMAEIENTLTEIQHVTFVTCFDEIYPCLQQQLQQRDRLKELTAKCEENRDILQKKMEHAKTLKGIWENKINDTTFEYKEEKEQLLSELEAQKNRKNELEITLEKRYQLLANIRSSLKQFQQVARVLEERPPENIRATRSISRADTDVLPPKEEAIEGRKIMQELMSKFSKLISVAQVGHDECSLDEQHTFFEAYLTDIYTVEDLEKNKSVDSLMEGIAIEGHVLTRDDIKQQSAEIVLLSQRNDDLIPMFAAPKKRRKF